MKKEIIGQCCICGKTKKLTKEHVPPQKAFNSARSHGLSGDNLINAIQNKKYKTTINQSGSCDYTLCAECNNNTGTWYADHYVEFVHYIHQFCKDRTPDANCLTLKAKQIKFGNVIKEIFTMLASSLHYNTVKKLGIDKYLMEKDNFNLDTSKFKLYCYLNFDYMTEKTGLITTLKTDGKINTFVSLKTYPLGFVLNLKPEDVDPAWENMLDLEDVINVGNDLLSELELNIPIINNYQPAFNTNNLIEDIRKRK